MKKVARRIHEVICPYPVMECPICGQRTVYNENMPWCAGCQTEYYESRKLDPITGMRRFIFDTKRKTPKYAFGKAMNASGGVRIGSKTQK